MLDTKELLNHIKHEIKEHTHVLINVVMLTILGISVATFYSANKLLISFDLILIIAAIGINNFYYKKTTTFLDQAATEMHHLAEELAGEHHDDIVADHNHIEDVEHELEDTVHAAMDRIKSIEAHERFQEAAMKTFPYQIIITNSSNNIEYKNDYMNDDDIQLIIEALPKRDNRMFEVTQGNIIFAVVADEFEQDGQSYLLLTIRQRSTSHGLIGKVDELEKKVNLGVLSENLKTEGLSKSDAKIAEKINGIIESYSSLFTNLCENLNMLAEGVLHEIHTESYQGQVLEMLSSYNRSINNFKDFSLRLMETVETLGMSATEIACGNMDLNKRTEKQSLYLSESASSMHELAGIVKYTATQANEVVTTSESAKQYAVHGGEVVNNAKVAMDEINERSQKIADIISVINNIAFQTNLLALNAAVEAARAGEHGRGFAVVATEVRNLSQRTSRAAKEIKNLIENSVTSVASGVELVTASREALEQIVEASTSVTERVKQMAQQSLMQSSGIEQVNENLTRINEFNSNNTVIVEEVAAASESMEKQFEEVSEIINFFKFDEKRQVNISLSSGEQPDSEESEPGLKPIK